MMTIETRCPFCGKINEVNINEEAFFEWQYGGKNIQDVVPEMSATDREMLISGICPECQVKIFGF